MAQFPTTEAEVIVLARELISGLRVNKDKYPNTPFSADDIEKRVESFNQAANDWIVKRSAFINAGNLKEEDFQEVVTALKSDIRFLENATDFNNEELKKYGWGGRSKRTDLEKPGQCIEFKVMRQGEGWIYMIWLKPTTGGKPATYRILMRKSISEPWKVVGDSVITEVTLNDQERGVEIEYCVMALNRAGAGMMSNVVKVVL